MITSMRFVIAEATSGAVSLLTGQLSIPPLVGASTAVGVAIVVTGLAVAVIWVSKKEQQKEKDAEGSSSR